MTWSNADQRAWRAARPGYNSWASMKRRCFNANDPDYHLYGGRGITVCERWLGKGGFERFIADVGPKPDGKYSIDRIDVDGHYEPGNVRWATDVQQARNHQYHKLVTWNGETLSVAEWAERTGQSYHQLYLRLFRRRWDVKRALTT